MCFFIVAALVEGYSGEFLSTYFPFSLLQYAALAKAISTFAKYAFQTHHNYVRKSVLGVSVKTIFMDFTACVCLIS